MVVSSSSAAATRRSRSVGRLFDISLTGGEHQAQMLLDGGALVGVRKFAKLRQLLGEPDDDRRMAGAALAQLLEGGIQKALEGRNRREETHLSFVVAPSRARQTAIHHRP